MTLTQDARRKTQDAMPQCRNVANALSWASESLGACGIDEAQLDAELLLAHALRVRRGELVLRDEISADELRCFTQLIQRRRQREPLPYIIGTQDFMGLTFRVAPDVLIPRPETERLVEAVVERVKGLVQFPATCCAITLTPDPSPTRRERGATATSPLSRRVGEGSGVRVDQPTSTLVVDVGTGSGAIAVSLAHFLPGVQVYATDVSEAALVVARENAERLGVSERIAFAQGDCLEPLRRWGLQGRLHAMVSNPPYVPRDDLDSLQPEVSRYEPRLALDGGADGLQFYRRLAAEATEFLRPDGFIACEIGIHQSRAVCELFRRAGFAKQEVVKDYGGIERVVVLSQWVNESMSQWKMFSLTH